MTTTQTDRKVLLTLLAHPDDAEFLCGGTLLRLADEGWQMHVATMTPGDCGTMTDTRWGISATRTAEGKAAADKLGAIYHCLDERDIYVCYDKPTLRKAVDLFRQVAPTLVFTHAPRDYMMDHEMTSAVARAASFGYGAPNASTHPLIEGSCVPTLYYCDPLEGTDPLGHRVEPTTIIDISDQIDAKADLLACHASQREWLRAHHGMDEYLESMKRQSRMRGDQANVAFAEAFTQHRGHPYPTHDLLGELFGNLKS